MTEKPFDRKDYEEFASKVRTGRRDNHRKIDRYRYEFFYEPLAGGILRGQHADEHLRYASDLLEGLEIVYTDESSKESNEKKILAKAEAAKASGKRIVVVDTHNVTDRSAKWKYFYQFDTDELALYTNK